MDSPPEAAKPSTATASGGSEPSAATSDSPPVHESPFANYVSRLSPVKPIKVSNTAVAQGLFGLNSPPLVFTSPHLTQPRATSFLQRSYFPQVCENEDHREEFFCASCNVDKPSTSIRSPLVADTHMDAKTPSHDAPSSSSVCIDEYLSEPLEVECANSVNSASIKLKQVNDALQLSIINSSGPKEVVSEDNELLEIGKVVEKLHMSCKQDEEEPRGHPTSEIKLEEVQKEQTVAQLSTDCPSAEGDSLYHATNKEECRMEGAQACHLQRGFSRRCLQFEEALPPPCLVKTPLVVSRPSGIGLYLNSIATIKGGGPGSSSQIIDKRDGSLSSASMIENVSVTTGERTVKDEANVAAISEPFGKIEVLNVLQPLEATSLNERKPNLDFTNSFEGLNQVNPKKKRKRSSDADSDGCKRCNCKRTKCLKLYCDCFAAGIYCDDPCSCQGCFNRPEYKDTVLETRRQIESRNPLAFAPKIVQDFFKHIDFLQLHPLLCLTEDVTEFPSTIGDDKSVVATSSVRHKRGCNCKKSMCLKKYCECYQANVGCSHEYRCEGCKNLYGKKEEYRMADDMISLQAREGTLEGPGDDKGLSYLELYDQHSMTPSTPLFQFSDHGKDAPKPRFVRFVPSPESDPSMLPPYARTLKYPSNAYSNDVSQETSKELVSHSSDQLMHYEIQMMNQCSPGSEEIAGICDFSPSQNPSLPPASSKTRSWIPPCPGSGRLLPTGPLLRRISPMTPMAPSNEVKNQVLDSSGELHNIIDDDTPDILKDSTTPSTSVKVTSPNKKRVSAPHGNLGESSSVGVKSGHKFILKAVPSFPPLTPCMDSKSSTREKRQ